jgi:hypothetical protein
MDSDIYKAARSQGSNQDCFTLPLKRRLGGGMKDAKTLRDSPLSCYTIAYLPREFW